MACTRISRWAGSSPAGDLGWLGARGFVHIKLLGDLPVGSGQLSEAHQSRRTSSAVN
jgi:hypothetical protein